MRTAYLVTYDISDPKRLRRVYQCMRGFGDHLQLSVFRCVLGERELVQMKGALLAVINTKEDQVLIVHLGPEEGRGSRAISSLGRAYVHPERSAIIV